MGKSEVSVDEARKEAQHESIKSQIESDVNADIAERAGHRPPPDRQKMEAVAGTLRGKAIAEVVETDSDVRRARGLARVSQVVDYIFYIIYTLLAIRLVLALMAARPTAGFMQFIFTVTNPFYSMFRGIVASPSVEGGYTLALPIVVAIVAYALLHAAINGLLRLIAHRKTEL